ncbi:MAG: hypothetical protein ACT4QD_26005 [Acidobacteriota bacterium]
MRIPTLLAVVMTTALASSSVRGSVVLPPTFEGMVASAGEIFLGEVVERASRFVERDGKRLIVTDITFRTVEVLKGAPGTLRTLTFLGGTIGDVHMEVQGMPWFLVGDKDVLFVRDGRSFIPLVAMFHGRFRVVTGRGGAGEFVANYARQPVRSVATYHAPARLGVMEVPLSLRDFLDTVRTLTGRR